MSEMEPKRRRVTFADLAAAREAVPAAPPAQKPEEPAGRVTYADLAALSKRPEDFTGTPAKGLPVTPPPATASAPVTGTPVTGTPPAVAVIFAPVAGVLRGGRQIRQAMSAEEGHSFGEQAVYAALWAAAQPHAPDCRVLTIGYRALSHACRLTVNNCKANLHSLARKLAIEEAGGHSYTQAKTYRVYSPEAILERRKAAGLVYYVKSRGVTFVDPQTGIEIGVPGPGIPGRARA